MKSSSGVVNRISLKRMVFECSRNKGRSSQEQIQIIATAIGKPMMKASATTRVKAKIGFALGRTLSADMSLAPSRGPIEKPPTVEDGDGFQLFSRKSGSDAARIWLTEGYTMENVSLTEAIVAGA
jgi:hypothetical protein